MVSSSLQPDVNDVKGSHEKVTHSLHVHVIIAAGGFSLFPTYSKRQGKFENDSGIKKIIIHYHFSQYGYNPRSGLPKYH